MRNAVTSGHLYDPEWTIKMISAPEHSRSGSAGKVIVLNCTLASESLPSRRETILSFMVAFVSRPLVSHIRHLGSECRPGTQDDTDRSCNALLAAGLHSMHDRSQYFFESPGIRPPSGPTPVQMPNSVVQPRPVTMALRAFALCRRAPFQRSCATASSELPCSDKRTPRPFRAALCRRQNRMLPLLLPPPARTFEARPLGQVARDRET
jgi:hypothetical protein